MYDTLPFERGKTAGVSAVTDEQSLLGKEYHVPDYDMTNYPKLRSDRIVKLRAVRNDSGIALLPKRLARFKAATKNTEIDGYCTTTAAPFAGVVDEWLPSAGVADNDIFFIVVGGPSNCLTDIASVDTITEGDSLVSLTAVTSQATTAGRVDAAAYAVTETSLANQIKNEIGRALEAKTSANTNADILVDIRYNGAI